MANTFSSSLMPRILAGALQVLREEVAFAKHINKDFEGSAGHLGQVVSVSIPYAQTSYAITPAALPPALTDTKLYSRLITIDQWFGTRFSFTPAEMVNFDFSNSQFVPRQIAEAARTLSRTLNQALSALWPKIPNTCGTVSSRLFASNIDSLADVRTRLNYQLCPPENRMMLMSLLDENDAMKLDDVKKNPQMAGDHDVYRKALLGRIYDIDLVRDRDIATSGVVGAGVTGLYTSTAASRGDTTLTVTTGANGVIDLTDGQTIMLSSDSGNQLTRTHYAVQGVVSQSNPNTAAVITLDHPLEAAQSANFVVSIPTGQGIGSVNIAGDLSGFGLVMRIPPSSIEGAPTIGPVAEMTDPVSGIPLKLIYMPGYHSAQFELSMLYGCDVVDWRRLLRVYSRS